jgi:hypothetical protein
MRAHSRITLALVTIGLGVAALGCRSTTSIKTLLDDPSRYDHQKVAVAGEVKESAGVLGYGGYRLDDGTGTILVVTSSGGAPRTGARVGVEGEFRSAFTIGSESAAAIMESKRFTP